MKITMTHNTSFSLACRRVKKKSSKFLCLYVATSQFTMLVWVYVAVDYQSNSQSGCEKNHRDGGAQERKLGSSAVENGEKFYFRGVEFIKSALEINFFNYFLNYPFHSFNIFFFHSLTILSISLHWWMCASNSLPEVISKSVQIMEFKANFHINKHIWKISNTEIGLCFNII